MLVSNLVMSNLKVRRPYFQNIEKFPNQKYGKIPTTFGSLKLQHEKG